MASIFDLFDNNNAQQAALDQIQGLNQGYGLASNAINQGSNDLTSYYTQALQPFLQNYSNATTGTNALMAALGLAPTGSTAGPTGAPTATPAAAPAAAPAPAPAAAPGGFGAAPSTPASAGQAVAMPSPAAPSTAPAAPAAGGSAASPQAAAYASNPAYDFLMQQGSQNVLRNAAQTGTTASGATLNALQTQGQGLANTTYQQYVQNLMPFLGQSNTAAAGIGSVNTGLGSGLNANQGSLANLGWQLGTGIGNANANAALANQSAAGNMMNVLGGIAGLGVSGGGTFGGNLLMSMFSDERVKEDIEKVGELYDGTGVYKYHYLWDDPAMTRIGVMAQEVEQTRPDAVHEVGGIKMVDYGRATEAASLLAKFRDNDNDDGPRGSYAESFAPFLEAA